ncbi:hypothetical protein [Curtobacterium sp. MCBD17_032]|uniref:hypothetical protein n=1 Tax=Curtobacterium sp. MCBD17_032 TaxID=2175659 RepID=UPI0011B44AF3|nr:hypothetical protein [Curtobacterium sp. MCBD17_032]
MLLDDAPASALRDGTARGPVRAGRVRVRRGTSVLALVVAGASLLTGCAPEPVDEAALTRWTAAHQTAEDGDEDVLGVLSGQVAARDRARDVDVGGGVSMTFARHAQITAVDFSCFGDGAMTGFVVTRSGSSSRSTGVDPVACAEGVHRVRLPATWRADVDEVSFTVGDSTRDSAWSLTVRGTGGA